MSGIGLLLGQTRVDLQATTARRDLAETNVDRYGRGAELLTDAALAPLTSLDALRNAVTVAGEETDGAADATERLNEALAAAGGGAAGAAAGGLNAVGDAADKAREAITKMLDEYNKKAEAGAKSVSDMLSNVILEGKSAASVVGDLLKQLAQVQIQKAVFGLASGGGFLGGLFSGLGEALTPPTFDGGGYTGMGARAGGLDGKGGFMAMLHPNETVTDHTKGGRSSTASSVEVVIRMDESCNLVPVIERTAGNVVARARSGIVQESVAATYAASSEVPFR